MITIQVSDLVKKVNAFLHRAVNLENALISGELSNVKYVNGHCYFDLKDENGQLACTLWRTNAMKAGFRLEDGMAVLVHGSLTIYEKRGSLQLSVDFIEPAGLGALYLQLEQTRKMLASQGYFDEAHKKRPPAEIQKVGIVTGASTAALQDVMKTIRTRWPMLEVHLFNTPVQGKDAPPKIVKALEKADASGMDAILLVRGGGSFEDLFCFNDPSIVKALYNMKTYTVTGIGHEIDTSLADLAADHRAVTPTAAAQWITPDQREVKASLAILEKKLCDEARHIFGMNAQKLMYLQAQPVWSNPKSWLQSRKDRAAILSQRLMQLSFSRFGDLEVRLNSLNNAMHSALHTRISREQNRADAMRSAMLIHSPNTKIRLLQNQLPALQGRMEDAMSFRLQKEAANLQRLDTALQALSPERILQQGYSIVTYGGKTVRSAADLQPGQSIAIRFASGQANAAVESIQSESNPAENPAEAEI